ncbi:MAG: tRNA (adenosine(37)-N6)-threonylcarbamoyltransferase complex transferase subunit TsaD, partial [Candidatus Zixiibacteriota bacterium]
FIPVNHIEGHLAANLIEHSELNPHHLCLIVSGGHTILVEVKQFGDYNILGNTKDDAAGEAFDKVAKIMGLGYPGGTRLNQLADSGDAAYYKFPRAMLSEKNYMFSYSGLKTAVALYIKKLSKDEFEKHQANIAASFQEAAVEVLVEKTIRAAKKKNIQHISLAGGVAANTRLRSMFKERMSKTSFKLFYPSVELCTDNAAMIAAAGYYRFQKEGPGELIANAVPYLRLEDM